MAVERLEAAAAIEDSMAYMEPPQLYQPVRHCLGHVQLLAGNFSAAEQARTPEPEAQPPMDP